MQVAALLDGDVFLFVCLFVRLIVRMFECRLKRASLAAGSYRIGRTDLFVLLHVFETL